MSHDNHSAGNFPVTITEPENKFTLYKTIYGKDKRKFDQKMLDKIIALEINQHLHKHPDVDFSHVKNKPIKHKDLSVTYTIKFVLKSK